MYIYMLILNITSKAIVTESGRGLTSRLVESASRDYYVVINVKLSTDRMDVSRSK